jgi:hypothetical protein
LASSILRTSITKQELEQYQGIFFVDSESIHAAALCSSFLISSSLVHILLQLPLRTCPIQSLSLLVLGTEVDADAVHTVSLILRVSEALALENVPEMSTTVVAYDFRPHHAHAGVSSLADSARHCVPESGPAAAWVELVVCLVEGCVATGASVDTSVGVVLVKGTGTGRLCTFLAEDAELL